MKHRLISTFLAGLAMLTMLAPAGAQTIAKTQAGYEYATGGITVAELRAMEKGKEKYSLWVTTAAKGSGAHLSDVKLKIVDSKKQSVLDTTIIGPWLMVQLPPGAYAVEATFKDQTQRRTTRIQKGDHHQMLMYFESPAEVSPDWVSPFKDSPYSGK